MSLLYMLLIFYLGEDLRTNPLEERGNDAIQNQHVISSNSSDDSKTFLILFELKIELLSIFWAWRHQIKEFGPKTICMGGLI